MNSKHSYKAASDLCKITIERGKAHYTGCQVHTLQTMTTEKNMRISKKKFFFLSMHLGVMSMYIYIFDPMCDMVVYY